MAAIVIENHSDFLPSFSARAAKNPSRVYSVKCADFLTIVTMIPSGLIPGKIVESALIINPDCLSETVAGNELMTKIITIITRTGYHVLKNFPSVFNCISKL